MNVDIYLRYMKNIFGKSLSGAAGGLLYKRLSMSGSPQFCPIGSQDEPRVVGIGDNTMSKITDRLIFELIKRQYHPYDTHEEFGRGFSAYQDGDVCNPHQADSISAQAWARGAEAAMHVKKATG
jgi:hypothetical protein